MEIFTWIQDNWQGILQVVTGLVTVASIVVRWTPTLKDDTWLLAVVKFLGKYVALNRSTPDDAIRSANGTPQEPTPAGDNPGA